MPRRRLQHRGHELRAFRHTNMSVLERCARVRVLRYTLGHRLRCRLGYHPLLAVHDASGINRRQR